LHYGHGFGILTALNLSDAQGCFIEFLQVVRLVSRMARKIGFALTSTDESRIRHIRLPPQPRRVARPRSPLPRRRTRNHRLGVSPPTFAIIGDCPQNIGGCSRSYSRTWLQRDGKSPARLRKIHRSSPYPIPDCRSSTHRLPTQCGACPHHRTCPSRKPGDCPPR